MKKIFIAVLIIISMLSISSCKSNNTNSGNSADNKKGVVADVKTDVAASQINNLDKRITKARMVPDYPNDIAIDDIDTIKFGAYNQYEKTGDVRDPIEWIVLTKDDGKALLLSKNLLDCKSYNNELNNTSWADSKLRIWLNDDFYYEAFDEKERGRIVLTKRKSDEDDYDNTDDIVFCLSKSEEKKYFGQNRLLQNGVGIRPAIWVSYDQMNDEIKGDYKKDSGQAKEMIGINPNMGVDETFTGFDGDYYYVDGEKVINDWIEKDDDWYFAKSDGQIAKAEWVPVGLDYFYFKENGKMARNEWVEEKYYVGNDGKMLSNSFTPDGYYVGLDGSYVSFNFGNTTNNVDNSTNNNKISNNTSKENVSKTNDDNANDNSESGKKFDKRLLEYYHTVNDGKSKEYSEAKFDKDGKLWMYRDIGNNQYGIMIYDSFDKKTYYFFDDDNESYAKDGKTISMAEAERIYTKWDGFSDYYEAYMDGE